MPSFNLELCLTEDGEAEPKILIALCNVHLEESERRSIAIPLETPRRDIYALADQFASFLNSQNLSFKVVSDHRKLYAKYNEVMWRHRMLTAPPMTDSPYMPYIPKTVDVKALEKAKALLTDLNPDLVNRIDKGKPFYLQGTKNVYIVSPSRKNIDVLLPEGPVSLCVYITDFAVNQNIYDWMITMWKYISSHENEFLKTANHFDFYLAEGDKINSLP